MSWVCHPASLSRHSTSGRKWNKESKMSQARQWTQAFCKWNKSVDINMLCIFAKFVKFGERQRSLIPTSGFVFFVQFVVKTKEHNCCWQQVILLTKILFYFSWLTPRQKAIRISEFSLQQGSHNSHIFKQPYFGSQIRELCESFVTFC